MKMAFNKKKAIGIAWMDWYRLAVFLHNIDYPYFSKASPHHPSLRINYLALALPAGLAIASEYFI